MYSKHLVLTAFAILAIPQVQAAGIDCEKASKPVDQAICMDRLLSEADARLNDAYTYLLSTCVDIAAHVDLRTTQRHWVAGVRKDYGAGGPEALDRLAAAYRARNEDLAKLLDECNPSHAPVRTIVRTVKEPEMRDAPQLFVETNPPQVGWRINKALFSRYATNPPLHFNEIKDFFAKHKTDDSGGFDNYSLVFNQGNLLVLNDSGTECAPDAPRCSPYDAQLVFDVRTGSRVALEDLYTEPGSNTLLQRLREKLYSLAKSKLSSLPKADAEAFGEQYGQCMADWLKGMEISGHFTQDGRMQFVSGNCSHYTEYGPDPGESEGTALDNLSLTAAMPELRPYLNAYGKSLLLGEGDVRAPQAEPTLVCKKSGSLPVRRNDHPPAQGIQASAGESHYLLLTRGGRLWGWGEGNDGELGPAAQGHNPVPLLQGDDYAQAGGGQFYTAALRRDGTLWTWGSNYRNRLGDGADKSSAHPVRIGEGFVSLKVEGYGAMALKRDGTVWGWGEKLSKPQQLMADVAQIEYGPRGERLMLNKDGSIWGQGGFSPSQYHYDDSRPRLIGKGFTRLAVHGGDLAYKADGSLWVWGELLSSTFHLSGQESFEHPVNVGSGFVYATLAWNGIPYFVGLKADGSLWLAKTRGGVTRPEPVGCDYVDVATTGSGYLLTLKSDGSLVLWQAVEETADTARGKNLVKMSPWGWMRPTLLGKGYKQLFQVDVLWGSGDGGAMALKDDNTVWALHPTKDVELKDWFSKVPFPQKANIDR